MKPLKSAIKAIFEYTMDAMRYLSHSSTLTTKHENLESRIIAHYHVLEKGLCMPNFRYKFGQEIISSLLDLLARYEAANLPLDNPQFRTAVSVLCKYYDLHLQNGQDISSYFPATKYEKILTHTNNCGGYIELEQDSYFSDATSEFSVFAQSRFSIREFSDRSIPLNLIENAITVAQKSPSVCNRQTSRVYYFQSREITQKLLLLQNGNRGFGHQINHLLIVTSTLQSFDGINERYQSYIDGGMFAMSLLYALHNNKLAACPLNWSVTNKTDKRFKELSGIPDHENIIMLIGVGYPPKSFKAASSTRKALREVLSIKQ